MSNELFSSLEEDINNKEEEIKQIFYAKVKKLQNEIQEKDKRVLFLEEKLDKLKADYEFNYNLIEERDNDLKIFEEKIDSFNLILQEKENDIKLLTKLNEDFSLKLINEKTKELAPKDSNICPVVESILD